MGEIVKISIGEVRNLLKDGKRVRVKSIDDEFVDITNFYDKGYLDTFEVELSNGLKIKTSADHRFFSNIGWLETKNLIVGKHSLLCDDGLYHTVVSVSNIGKHKIVDISVNHPRECYYGNGILNHNSGKSLLAAHALADTQRQGGIAVLIDTENAVSTEFLEAIGVNLKELLYVPLETLEDIFETIDSIVETIRKSSKSRIVTIVVDSIAGATTKTEQAADYDKDGWATAKALILSKAMRKITNFIGRERICLILCNQLRQRLGVTFGDTWGTSGGKAIAFHASVRLRLKSIAQIKLKVGNREEIMGSTTRALVIKNRLGPPLRSVDYDIYYDSGIDNYGSWLTMLKEYDLVRQGGAWYTYVNTETGEEVKFQSKEFIDKVISDPDLKAQVYKSICDKFILNYKAGKDFGVDDIIIDTEFNAEES